MQLTDRQKRLLKWIGYPLLAIVSFIFAIHHTFPYDRLKGKIVEVVSEKYDISIMSIEPKLLPGGVVLDTVMLRTRPEKPGEKPAVFVLNKVEVDIGLFAAITGDIDVDILAELAGGSVEGNVVYNKAGLEASLETDGLPLANLPGVANAVGLPMAGGLQADIALKLPKMKWKDAEGHIKLSCNGCTVGDGEAKLQMKPREGRRFRRTNAFAKEGVTVPKLDLGAAVAEVDIEKGVGKIKQFSATSKDGTLKIEGEIKFADPFKNSTLPGCMHFKLSEDLKKREPNFGNIELMLPAQRRLPDGTFAIPTKGKLSSLRWDVRRQCGTVEGGGGDDDGKRSRPTITTRPTRDPNSGMTRGGTPTRGGDTDSTANHGSEDPGEAEAIRRAGNEPGNDEPEVDNPGKSGPQLGPASARTIRGGDDVHPPNDEADREPGEGGVEDRSDRGDDDDDDDDQRRGDDDDDDDDQQRGDDDDDDGHTELR